jgi:hypothetical protein
MSRAKAATVRLGSVGPISGNICTMPKGLVSEMDSNPPTLVTCGFAWLSDLGDEQPQVRDIDEVSEAQGLLIGHASEIALASTFAIGGAR